MKIAYLVCFVALLQVSTCASIEGSTPTSTDSSTQSPEVETFTENNTTDAETDIGDETSAATTTMNLTNETGSTESPSTSTDSDEVETVGYKTAVEGSSTTTTAKPSNGNDALVHPTALAIVVPVCLRLFSTKLVGVV